jgi:hypothetical protein
MGFGSKSSSTPKKDPEPTFKQVETTNDPQQRRTLGVRRAERFQTRDQPAAHMLEGDESGYGSPAPPGTATRKARMMY